MSFELEPGLNPVCFEDFVQTGHGVVRRLVFPQKDERNPVLEPEMPWEATGVLYPSVWKSPENGRWRMWYSTREKVICYAESDDGVDWRRPELGRVAHGGSKANNIVLAAPHPTPCVYCDPAADPDQRYRLTVSDTGHYQHEGGIKMYASPDGIDWTLLRDPAINVRNDSQCPILKHPKTGEWLAYHRPGFGLRTLTCSKSPDGLAWRGGGHKIFPDDLDRPQHIENYAIAVFPCHGGFIGIMKQFANVWYDKRCWLELVVSRDGLNWQRLTDRRPIIPLGGDGAWDSLCMSPGHGFVPEGDGHWFYYDCWNARHTGELNEPYARSCIGRAFFVTNRLAEIYATGQTAWVATVPCRIRGEKLEVDYDAANGEIRGQIEYEDSAPAEGFALEDSSVLTGCSHEGEIRFRGGSLGRFGRVPVRIAIHLQRGARVYAFGVA